MRVRLLIAVAISICVSSVAFAQTRTASRDTATVLEDVPIYILPDASRGPLRVAARGTLLSVIAKAPEGWVEVQFQDPQFGVRQGFIQARYVRIENLALQPMDLSVPGAKPKAATDQRSVATAQVDTQQRPQEVASSPPRSPLPRNGFWFNVGLGFGTLTCAGCEGSYINGLSGGLAAGGTLNPHVLMGVGTTGWSRSEGTVSLTAGTFDLRFRIYPSAYHGFLINAGIGVGSVTYKVGSLSFTETGLGIMYGVGWDIRTGRNISITPFWNGSGIATDSETLGFGQIGVGITIH